MVEEAEGPFMHSNQRLIPLQKYYNPRKLYDAHNIHPIFPINLLHTLFYKLKSYNNTNTLLKLKSFYLYNTLIRVIIFIKFLLCTNSYLKSYKKGPKTKILMFVVKTIILQKSIPLNARILLSFYLIYVPHISFNG
jgi:hypothetical protein